jgi:hypothetical protein
LVSWWPAEGNANDVVSGNNGTPNSGVSFGPGNPGQAFVFDGISGAVGVGNPPSLQVHGGDLTIVAWVNLSSLSSPSGSPSTPPGDMSIVTKMVNGGENADGWRLLKQLDNHFWFCLGDPGNGCVNGASTTVVSSTLASPNVWYCVAGVRSATAGISIYVDGALDGSQPPPTYTDSDSGDFNIGDYPRTAGDSFMYGAIDEVQFYNRALSGGDIASTCANPGPSVPEASSMALIPLSGIAVLVAVLIVRRRFRRVNGAA